MTEQTTLRECGTGCAWVQEPLTPELGLGAAAPRQRGRDRWWVRCPPSITVWPVVADYDLNADASATDAESEA
jgi:hypothetical protein